MKTILILLCVLTLASCGSRSGDRAERNKNVTTKTFDHNTVNVTASNDIKPPTFLKNNVVDAFVKSGKGRYINSTLAIIKHSQYADSLVYWTYAVDNTNWQFLDLK